MTTIVRLIRMNVGILFPISLSLQPERYIYWWWLLWVSNYWRGL